MNILLSSVGRRTYLVKYFKEALKGKGLVHAGNLMPSIALNSADKSVLTPHIYDAFYIDFLLDYCIKFEIKAIIPLFDLDIPILSKNKELFISHGIKVLVPDYEMAKICNDKWLTYNLLSGNQIPTAKTFHTLFDCKQAIINSEIEFPLYVKPRWGMGSQFTYIAENKQELNVFYKKIKKNIFSSNLRFESLIDPDHSVIIQEMLKGEEFGINILSSLEGDFLKSATLRKISTRGGETDSAEVVNNYQLHSTGREIASLIKHPGVIDIDCFIYEDKLFLLEMNCRFGGQYPFFHIAGINFVRAIVDLLTGLEISQDLFEARIGVVSVKDINPVEFEYSTK
jgi:carbamoyl-phosphate synthase large subunit